MHCGGEGVSQAHRGIALVAGGSRVEGVRAQHELQRQLQGVGSAKVGISCGGSVQGISRTAGSGGDHTWVDGGIKEEAEDYSDMVHWYRVGS